MEGVLTLAHMGSLGGEASSSVPSSGIEPLYGSNNFELDTIPDRIKETRLSSS